MKYTLQSAFDKIYKTVVVDGMNTRNVGISEWASYEHLPFGCFIGLLLPRELATKVQRESEKVKHYRISVILVSPENEVFNQVIELFSDFSYNEIQALSELQYIHDTSSPEDWKKALTKFAQHWCLTIPTVEESQNV